MDGQRFDRLAREMAEGRSRRGVLRGVVGGLAGAMLTAVRSGPAAAQDGYYRGPGEPCYESAQCVGADAYLICSDNGTGGFACCTLEGGNCGFDAACCGSSICNGGSCGAPLLDPGDPGVNQGLNQTGDGFSPGQACISDYQCDNTFPELGIAYCADNGYVYGAYGGALHCCRYAGGSCGGPLSDDHSICCGSLLCNGGTCG